MSLDMEVRAGVHVRREGETAIVVLDRPKGNATDLDMIEALTSTFRRLDSALPSGGVVITGTGPFFCAGVDMAYYQRLTEAERTRYASAVNRMIGALYFMPTAVVAAINGHAVGDGLVLALACDVRLVTADARGRFGLPGAAAGVQFPTLAMEVVSRELSPAVARRLCVQSELLPLSQAEAMGIADGSASPDSLLQTAVARARMVGAQPAFVGIKSLMRAQAAGMFAAYL